jgi:3-isopropylmalate dehydrogenase
MKGISVKPDGQGFMGKRVEIVTLPGDGIGPDVVAEGVKVLRNVAGQYNHRFSFLEQPIRGHAIDAVGDPFPEATLEACRTADAVLLGGVGGPEWPDRTPDERPERGLFELRQGLKLFANLRPVRVYPELVDVSPLKAELLVGVDVMFVRELTGGIYFGERREATADDASAYDTMVYQPHEI